MVVCKNFILEVSLCAYFTLQAWVRREMSIFYFKDLEPIRCTKCFSKDFEHKTTDNIDYIECEFAVSCKKCDTVLGYWAYGYYDPSYLRAYIEIGNYYADKEAQHTGERYECFSGGGGSSTESITDISTF